MKKLNLLILVSLLCAGLVQAKQATTQYERALINAAKEGNASQVRGLLEVGTDPNVTDEHGNTPLIYAAKENLAAVDMLLFAGADVNAKGENGITALINSFAVVGPEANTIRTRLLKAKPDVNAVAYVSQGQLHPLHVTCGEYQIYYRFNKEPSGSDAPVYGSASALSFAVASDDISAVEMLLKNGADVNIALMHPILFTAIYSNKPNSTKIVELLLKAGADPWQGGEDRENALRASQVSREIADRGGKQKLIKKAMVPTKKQHKLDEKLYEASKKGDLKQVKKLLEQGANPNSHFGVYYETPLMAATKTNDGQSVEVMKALINAGAEVNARNRSHSTALYCGSTDKDQDSEKTKLLLTAGADVNARNMYGNVPLFDARFNNKKTQLLLKAGADVKARNYEGLGIMYYNYDEMFLKRGAVYTPKEEQRQKYERQLQMQAAYEARAEKAASGNSGLGQTLLQGLLNAANDTANFAIQNAGKF